MGVAVLGVICCYHICSHCLTKTAWTGDTNKTILFVQLSVKNLNEQGLIDIKLIVDINLHVFCARIYICSHVLILLVIIVT